MRIEAADMLSHTQDCQDYEAVYISVAIDLLRQMMSELQRLEVQHSSFREAMANAKDGLNRQLDSLDTTTELLSGMRSCAAARELTKQAKRLIQRMAEELDRLIAGASYH